MSRVEHIGLATLHLADCRDVVCADADALITSPPYNCGKDYGDADDALALEDFSTFLTETLFAPPARIRVINVGQYVGSRKDRVLFRDLLIDAAGWCPLVDEVIWDKGPANGAAWGNFPNSPRIRAQHESIYAFGDARMPNGNGLDWPEWSRLTTSIWRVAATVDLKLHPAMMPVEVASRCVRLWSDVNGTVFDPFMGSGTTGVAAVHAGRSFVGVEQDPRYFDIACKRIDDAQRQGSLFTDSAGCSPPACAAPEASPHASGATFSQQENEQ